tara:strand:- start:406 stop:582 length:177 start_codon:yes stop_codon:yes gene_type:complete
MKEDKEYAVVVADFSKAYRNRIRNELNWPTFPIIVLVEGPKNTIIGGFNELEKHLARL